MNSILISIPRIQIFSLYMVFSSLELMKMNLIDRSWSIHVLGLLALNIITVTQRQPFNPLPICTVLITNNVILFVFYHRSREFPFFFLGKNRSREFNFISFTTIFLSMIEYYQAVLPPILLPYFTYFIGMIHVLYYSISGHG